MDPIRRELREFYEAEAAASTRGPAAGRRVQAAATFAELLQEECRTRVLDVGAGPGTDASTFEDAGLTYVGVDLAVGNASRASERGHDVIAASLFDLPFRRASLDAGWSMSTLMHVPADEFDVAMRAVLNPLRPGAPLGIGMWGGAQREFRTEPGPDGTRRLFSLRTADNNRAMLAAHGAIERWEVWDAGPSDWEYHHAVLRLPSLTPQTWPGQDILAADNGGTKGDEPTSATDRSCGDGSHSGDPSDASVAGCGPGRAGRRACVGPGSCRCGSSCERTGRADRV